jgi:hypothetical protein
MTFTPYSHSGLHSILGPDYPSLSFVVMSYQASLRLTILLPSCLAGSSSERCCQALVSSLVSPRSINARAILSIRGVASRWLYRGLIPYPLRCVQPVTRKLPGFEGPMSAKGRGSRQQGMKAVYNGRRCGPITLEYSTCTMGRRVERACKHARSSQ